MKRSQSLRRSGVSYVELVELVKTLFINPYQSTLDFLQDRLAGVELPLARRRGVVEDARGAVREAEGGAPQRDGARREGDEGLLRPRGERKGEKRAERNQNASRNWSHGVTPS